MSKDTAELERENAKLNEVAVNLQRSRGRYEQENAKLRMVLQGIKWCHVQHSNIEHEADHIGFPTFLVSAQVVLPKEYDDALIDAGKLRDLLPGLVLNCLTPRPQQGKEGGAE